jgi:hypothetical protein
MEETMSATQESLETSAPVKETVLESSAPVKEVALERPGLKALISHGEQTVKLKTPSGEATGIEIKFKPLDGQTKLRHATRISNANTMRNKKRSEAIDQAYVKLFDSQYLRTVGLIAEELAQMGGDPKAWFMTDPEGIVLMRIATDEYYSTNVSEAEADSKN